MRVKNLSNFFLVLLALCFISCEESQVNLEINPLDYYGDGSYFISLNRLSTPEIIGDNCGTEAVLEIRSKQDLKEYGTVIIYSDGRDMSFQVDLISDRIMEGWEINGTIVWIGLQEEWKEGRDGPEDSWKIVEGMEVLLHQSRPTNAIHKIQLENWMFEDCLTIAIRVSVRSSIDFSFEGADGFINNGDYLTFSWNEPICIEKCDDPGTHEVDYWENNPDVWTNGVTIGGVFYSEELAIQIMKGITTSEDMSNVLFEELISTKLNVELGNTSYCIIDVIEAADTWMQENGPVGRGILSDHPAWDTGNSLASQLESYNNGLMCADPTN